MITAAALSVLWRAKQVAIDLTQWQARAEAHVIEHTMVGVVTPIHSDILTVTQGQTHMEKQVSHLRQEARASRMAAQVKVMSLIGSINILTNAFEGFGLRHGAALNFDTGPSEFERWELVTARTHDAAHQHRHS